MSIVEEIQQTLARYAFAYDEADFDLLVSCFTERAVVRFPSTHGGVEIQGRDELIAHFRRARAQRTTQVRHVITNVLVLDATDGDTEAISYVVSLTIDDAASVTVEGTGVYRDTFTREDGVLRFAQRVVTADGHGADVAPISPRRVRP